MILNAGTLALSFTAATTFHTQHAQAMASLSSLLWAWQLLILAIVLSIVSNWMSVTGVVHFGIWQSLMQQKFNFGLVRSSLRKFLAGKDQVERIGEELEGERFGRHEKSFGIFDRPSQVVGFCAQCATFWAFVLLYQFAKAVVTGS